MLKSIIVIQEIIMIQRLIGIGKKGRPLRGFPRMSIDTIAISLDMSGADVGWMLMNTLSKYQYKQAVLKCDRNSEIWAWRYWRNGPAGSRFLV